MPATVTIRLDAILRPSSGHFSESRLATNLHVPISLGIVIILILDYKERLCGL